MIINDNNIKKILVGIRMFADVTQFLEVTNSPFTGAAISEVKWYSNVFYNILIWVLVAFWKMFVVYREKIINYAKITKLKKIIWKKFINVKKYVCSVIIKK